MDLKASPGQMVRLALWVLRGLKASKVLQARKAPLASPVLLGLLVLKAKRAPRAPRVHRVKVHPCSCTRPIPCRIPETLVLAICCGTMPFKRRLQLSMWTM